MPFQFFDPSKTVTITRGHLPHWDQEGACYFLTWRTADSMPKRVWEQWRNERDRWLQDHSIAPGDKDWRLLVEQLNEEERKDFRRFAKALDDEMDAGHGECLLRRPELAKIVAESLHHFDSHQYVLGGYVVMPNHVHVLVGGLARATMLKQVESWKKWSAMKINKALARSGRFWQDEHYDHLV